MFYTYSSRKKHSDDKGKPQPKIMADPLSCAADTVRWGPRFCQMRDVGDNTGLGEASVFFFLSVYRQIRKIVEATTRQSHRILDLRIAWLPNHNKQ